MPSETILVVEDSPITRKMVRIALEAAGYAVLEAGDGRTALDLATRHLPSLVLQDLLLPDMNGIDLCRQLRSSGGGAEIPIIAFSGLQSGLDDARSFQAGFTDYLYKPVAPSRLIDVINTYLPAKVEEKTKPGGDRRVLLVGDDPVQRRLNKLQLEEHGFRVTPVQDAADALARARETPPDAIVADVLMPGMNGPELCLAIRADPQLTQLPVILALSTLQYLEDADRAIGQQLGASDLVPRTPGLKEIIAALVACQGAGPPPQPSPDARSVASKYLDRLLRQAGVQASLNYSLAHRAALDAALLSITSCATAIMSRELSLQQMLDEVLGCALEAGGISAGAIYLLEPEGEITLRSHLGSVQEESLRFFGHVSLLREIIDSGRPVHIPHETLPEDVAGDLLRSADATSMVIAPLLSAGAPLGAMVMMTNRRGLEERWLTSIDAMARQLAQAVTLSNALEAMSERTRTAELNAEIGRALTDSTSLQVMLQRCARSFVQHLDATIARIWTLNQSDNVLELRASAGLGADAEIDVQHHRVSVGQFRVGLIAQERRPMVTNDLRAGPPMGDEEWARQVGVVAFAGYPLVVEDELVGVVAVFARHPLSGFSQRALETVAAGIGVGIQRRRAEEELLATKTRLEHVIASSGAVIYLLQADQGEPTPVWISDNVQRLMGFETAEAMVPGWWQEHVHPEDRDWVLGQHAVLLERGQLAFEYRFRHKDGTYRWILDEHRLVAAAPGSPAEVIGSWVDITERKRLEQQFLQAQKMEAIGRLAGGVAHDFNNILTGIMSYAQLGLLELEEQDPLHEYLSEISKGADRAAALIRQLLAFSRQQVLAPRVVDLNKVVAEVQRMLLRLVGEDVEVATELSPEPGRVKADPGQLHQVIANLVINASDAMPNGGKLTLETSNADLDETQSRALVRVPAGRYVVLAVTDTGTGMDEGTKARIFEPFFTTKEQGKGTGLGLSTVYGIVKQSNGFIWVYSELGLGTTFRVYLPRVEEPADALAVAPPPAQVPGGRESVLVAEDDEGIRSLVRVALSKRGYHVLVAANGGEALLLCEQHPGPIDLLLTDLVMPGMGGQELFKRLAPLRPQMRVLFVSGYADRAVLRHGEIAEGTMFLQKPFTLDVLARKVREVLDLPPG